MPDEKKFDFTLGGIAGVLEHLLLRVPEFQRSYAWGIEDPKDRDQVKEFWTDLQETFSLAANEYFLGTLVLSTGEGDQRASIIDGQQRLATTAIFLAAIRDIYRERGDDFRADTVHSRFLASADLASGEHIPRLILNAEDDHFFSHYVVKGEHNTPATRTSHTLIRRAYELAHASMDATANDAGGAWAQRLTNWINYLCDDVQAISVTVLNEADAFMIFETLNDRGADLTIADLLKNYLFGRAGNQLPTVRSSWSTALANLDIAVEGSQLFTDFIRHYWSSKNGPTRERELYIRIKEKVSTSANAVDLATELEAASRLYAAMLHSDHEFWSDYPSAVTNNVKILNNLALEQSRPLLLAMMQHLTKTELKRALRGMVSWSVRSPGLLT